MRPMARFLLVCGGLVALTIALQNAKPPLPPSPSLLLPPPPLSPRRPPDNLNPVMKDALQTIIIDRGHACSEVIGGDVDSIETRGKAYSVYCGPGVTRYEVYFPGDMERRPRVESK